MDISLIDSQHLCFADSVAQKLTPHFTYLESCCVFSHRLYYTRAFKARDERRFWRIINIPLTYHQVQKIQATATEKNINSCHLQCLLMWDPVDTWFWEETCEPSKQYKYLVWDVERYTNHPVLFLHHNQQWVTGYCPENTRPDSTGLNYVFLTESLQTPGTGFSCHLLH